MRLWRVFQAVLRTPEIGSNSEVSIKEEHDLAYIKED